eukprot:365229-Chlamydomonas_euryale.AAC.5
MYKLPFVDSPPSLTAKRVRCGVPHPEGLGAAAAVAHSRRVRHTSHVTHHTSHVTKGSLAPRSSSARSFIGVFVISRLSSVPARRPCCSCAVPTPSHPPQHIALSDLPPFRPSPVGHLT